MSETIYVEDKGEPLGPDYWLDNYGTCQLPVCECHKQGHWLGRACLHWQPLGVTSLEQLQEKMINDHTA